MKSIRNPAKEKNIETDLYDNVVDLSLIRNDSSYLKLLVQKNGNGRRHNIAFAKDNSRFLLLQFFKTIFAKLKEVISVYRNVTLY